MPENPIFLNLAIEDELSESLVRSILKQSKGNIFIGSVFRGAGIGYLREKFSAFNNAARGTPFLLLADLDSADCAPSLIKSWCGNTRLNKNFLFRIAVREAESWVLADRTTIAKFLGVPEKQVPETPDGIVDPKKTLLELAKKSKSREVRDALVRVKDGRFFIGPGYNTFLSEFVLSKWNAEIASSRSDSLKRTLNALDKLIDRLKND